MLNTSLKEAATAAFRDNARLAEIATEDRELAAQFYERIAEQVTGTRASLARLYNLERASFLRGEVDRIAPTAHRFAAETGIQE